MAGWRNPCSGSSSPRLNAAPLADEYRRAISREEIADLPIRRHEGETHVVATSADLERALVDLRQERVIGFDTETRPAFRKGEAYAPSLVQLATSRAVHLLQVQRLDCSRALAEILGAPHIVKAGVSVAGDLSQLRRLFPLDPAAVVDLGRVAKHHGLEQTGLRNLAARFLGFRIPKGARTSNWAAARLTPAQVTYAATDAWAGRELYLCFERLGLLANAVRLD